MTQSDDRQTPAERRWTRLRRQRSTARVDGGVDLSRPLLEWFRAYFAAQPAGDRAFVEAIASGRPAAPSFYDGWKAQEVIDAALESSRAGRWVTIAEARDA